MNNFKDTFGKLNRGSKYDFDTEELEFVKIKDIYDEKGLNIYPLRGFTKSTKGNYGDSYAFITPVGLINAKPNMHEQILPIYNGEQDVTDMINNGEVFIQFHSFEYTQKINDKDVKQTSYGFNYLSLDEVNELESGE